MLIDYGKRGADTATTAEHLQQSWESQWRDCYTRCKGNIKCNAECDKLVPEQVKNRWLREPQVRFQQRNLSGLGATPIFGGMLPASPCTEDCPPDCEEEIIRERWWLTPNRVSPDDPQVPVVKQVRTCKGESSEIECDQNGTPVSNPTMADRVRGLANAVDTGSGDTTTTTTTTYPAPPPVVYADAPCDCDDGISTTTFVLSLVATAAAVGTVVYFLNK
ncbi:MAG: hypothetical protein JNL32_00230 [Candidatus Kapabacteria bacterium]|nr:hypothetical protein [Candidatus Kapabacteria bacterium]